MGPPLDTAALEHERLGIPTALAVFASDCVSSCAYATEEILHVLIPVIGVLAFSLVLPITVAMCLVLFVLVLSYRQTIKEYPTAGGAYMVTRDNFGLMPAQVAGVSLLTDYILTVSVSTAAGTAALCSFFPVLTPYSVVIAVGFVAMLAFGNLKGVKDSGKIFAVPTYFFVVIMVVMIAVGLWKVFNGGLHAQDIEPPLRNDRHRPQGRRRRLPLRRRDLRGAPRLRLRRRGGHRRRGDLERRDGVPQTRVDERPQDVGHHGRHPRVAVPRPLVPGHEGAPGSLRGRRADGHLPDRQAGLRRFRGRAASSTGCSRPGRS